MYNTNNIIAQIMEWKEKGLSPQQVTQMLFQQNPQLQSIQTQFSNMAKGRSPKEFVMQLARQGGINQQNMQSIQGIFDNK